MRKCLAFLMAAVLGIGAAVGLGAVMRVDTICDRSMMPGLNPGQHILTLRGNLLNAEFAEPKQGDIVMMKNTMFKATGEHYLMVKRVIATEDDKVSIADGQVYLNGKPLREQSYLKRKAFADNMRQRRVPTGKFFVLGDNRGAGTDSRSVTVGMVDREDIIGKVIYKW